MQRHNTKIKRKIGVVNVLVATFLIAYSALMIILFVWGVFTSLKTRIDFYYNKLLWPSGNITTWGWDNYVTVFRNSNIIITNDKGEKVLNTIWNQLFNTIFYAGGIAFVKSGVCCIVAYMITKFNYKFSTIIYTLIIVSMVIPVIGSGPRMLMFFHDLNLYDTWLGIYIQNFDFLHMHTLIFCGMFTSISSDYISAAKIDGASEFRILFNIMIPMVMPVFTTVLLMNFITFWNEYQNVILYFKSHPTLAYGVYWMTYESRESEMSSETTIIAASMMLAIPILTVFIFLRNKIMGNITMGGIKE